MKMSDSEYSSDDDEDYIPDEESDEEEELETLETETNRVKKEQKTVVKKKKEAGRKRRGGIKLSSDEEEVHDEEVDLSAEGAEGSDEEDKLLDSQKEGKAATDKSKEDTLWAAFKSDVQSSMRKPKSTTETSPKSAESSANKRKETVTITKTFDFAGEEVRVTKTVAADSTEAKKDLGKQPDKPKMNLPTPTASGTAMPLSRSKRPAGGGLGSVLGQIGKKAKISTLEKSRLDWENFKTGEGIAEDLKRHNKDGYLEKQDFLQRTDERQFEAERLIREEIRKK